MLYDRGKIFDTVASLVGLDMHEGRRLTAGHRGDPPIMVIGGSRGTGKTAALTAISRAYGNRVPRVLLDLADRRYSEEYGDPGSGSSPLLRMLQDMQWELEMKVRGNSRLQFPRLSLALLAIATWQPDEEITLAQANKRLAEAGDSVAKIARISASERGGWVDDWISEVVSELAVAGPPLDGSTILAISAPRTEDGGPWTVTQCLLAQLLPDPAWRSRLITLAAARDFSAAQALVAAHLTSDQDRLTATGAWLLLRENGWEAGEPDPEHFVGDPFLRTLLLEELRDRTVSPTSAEVHATLRDLYPGAASGPLGPAEPARLFHCLALGDCPHVVRRFRDAFGAQDADAGAWVAALRTVVSAPHSGYPDHRRDAALGAADRAGHDEVHRSVNRLLHAAWYLTDPLVAPDQEVADKIAAELNLLAQKNAAGHQVLSEAGISWRRQLLGWQQAAARPVRPK